MMGWTPPDGHLGAKVKAFEPSPKEASVEQVASLVTPTSSAAIAVQ
jgi:hypothetical protein